MKFEFIYEPIPIIIIRDIFSKEDNKEILAEAVSKQKEFSKAGIGTANSTEEEVEDFRNNTVLYYDDVYPDRSKSKLLKTLDSLFAENEEFKEILESSPHPINLFGTTNFHETQVSRYGEGQHYNYHIDAFSNDRRKVTFVYYFHEDPKQFTGGNLQITKSPIYKGIPADKSQKIITIEPENNMAVVFGSHVPHTVLPVSSMKDFSKGRFSVNCWIGFR